MSSKTQRIIGWVLSGIISAFLIVASGVPKLTGNVPADMLEKLGFTADTIFKIGIVEVLVAVLYVICTVLRLARFNVESGDSSKADRSFCGLPSPAAAGTVASFPLMVFGLKSLDITAQDILWDGFNAWVDWVVARSLPVITLLVACLMVSRVRFPDTVRYFVRGRHNVAYLIKVVFAVAVIFVMPQFAVPLLFGWYTFSTPVVALWQRCFRPQVAIAEEVPVERPRVEEA